MKNLTKNSVANVAKVGVASALIGAGLFLSACGGDSISKAEKLAKQAIEKDFAGAKILNFDEAKKVLGLTNKECLVKIQEVYSYVWNAVKMDDGLQILEVMIRNDNNFAGVKNTYSIDKFKDKKPECFN